MYSYIIRRLAFGALTVIGVSIIVFLVLRVLPGDPLVALFGPEGFTKLSEAERARYMADLGLSDPLAVQYFRWVGDIARGNFGRSFFRAESVGEMILRRGPLTAEIAVLSVVLSWLVGIPVAIVSARAPTLSTRRMCTNLGAVSEEKKRLLPKFRVVKLFCALPAFTE